MRKGKRVLQMKRVQIMRLSNLQFSCAPFSNILSNFIVILETLEMNKRTSFTALEIYSIYKYVYSHTSVLSFSSKNISNEETLFFLIAQSLKNSFSLLVISGGMLKWRYKSAFRLSQKIFKYTVQLKAQSPQCDNFF